jgi:AraC-like DNA-binding protein
VSVRDLPDGQTNAVPVFRLSSGVRPGAAQPPELLPGAAAFAAYCQVTQEIFACSLPEDATPSAFQVDMTAWHLGTVMLGSIRASALAFDRSPFIVKASGMDHLMVQLYTEGGFAGTAAGRAISVGAGDICVFDLSQTLRTKASAFHNLTLLVPRPYMAAAVENVPALHGMVLGGRDPLTEIMAEHLRVLAARVQRLDSTRAAESAARGTVALITTMLATTAKQQRSPAGAAPPSPHRRAMQLIDQRLADPKLDSERLAEELGMSRATLYRLFEPLGGVSAYIRRRRLTCAALHLASPDYRHERVSQIAFRWGFGSEGAFSRSFRMQFGLSPSEARERADRIWAAYAWGDEQSDPVREFMLWMRTLRE